MRRGVLLIGLLAIGADARGMDVRAFYSPDLEMRLVVGEGPIVQGDDERFRAVATQVDRDEEGHVVFVLNSPGGSVPDAFALVDAMDETRVYTVVASGAICASACASILFASGERRDLIGTGTLGFHSCYATDGDTVQESSFCNELIAANAIARDIPHASVSLFVNDYGAGDMAWVNRNVACTMLPRLCKPTLIENVKPGPGPSFACNKANRSIEKQICESYELSKLDRKLAAAYGNRSRSTLDRAVLKAQQVAWLRERDACQDRRCLFSAYRHRIRALMPQRVTNAIGTQTH